MSRFIVVLYGMLIVGAAGSASAQPPQFKANVRMKDGSNGSTSTGTMYVGASRTRMELTKDGQNIVVLVDPAAKSQVILMPGDKVYMQMPIGQGPVSVPVTGPSDPTNPCAGGSGNTDCVRGESEPVNGYAAVRWDYTSSQGVRTRAWLSTRFRFPVKVQDDNGSGIELSSIAEGPQPASLFGIPAGYTKMDVGAFGGRGARAASTDPMAAAMANMPPELAAAMAGATRGGGPTSPTVTGSGWETTKGWVINLTIKGTYALSGSGEFGTRKEADTATIVASIPLNLGSPASGLPGAPGPAWQILVGSGLGTKEGLATPITFNVDLSGRIDGSYKGNCAMAGEDAYTAVTTVKTSTQRRALMSDAMGELGRTQGYWRISGDLKTYEFGASIGVPDVKETHAIHKDAKACKDGHAYKTDDTQSSVAGYSVAIDVKDLPMPSAVGPVSGSKKMPMKLGDRQIDATVNWTISPIR